MKITLSKRIKPAPLKRNLMPLVWDLVEANIKRKGQLLLAWCNPLSLASSTCTAHQTFKHAATPVALGSSFGVMAITLAETLIALGASIQRCREL